MNSPEALWDRLLAHLQPADRPLVESAYALANYFHANHYRFGGGEEPRPPYIVHPLRVALILWEEWGECSPEVIATALLHDAFQGVLLTEIGRAHV